MGCEGRSGELATQKNGSRRTAQGTPGRTRSAPQEERRPGRFSPRERTRGGSLISFVTDAFHHSSHLDDAARCLIALDGSLDREAIAQQLLAALEEHEVSVRNEEGEPLTGEQAAEAMRRFVDQPLAAFARDGLLER